MSKFKTGKRYTSEQFNCYTKTKQHFKRVS